MYILPKDRTSKAILPYPHNCFLLRRLLALRIYCGTIPHKPLFDAKCRGCEQRNPSPIPFHYLKNCFCDSLLSIVKSSLLVLRETMCALDVQLFRICQCLFPRRRRPLSSSCQAMGGRYTPNSAFSRFGRQRKETLHLRAKLADRS